jgi:hypothetical protein
MNNRTKIVIKTNPSAAKKTIKKGNPTAVEFPFY